LLGAIFGTHIISFDLYLEQNNLLYSEMSKLKKNFTILTQLDFIGIYGGYPGSQVAAGAPVVG